MLRRIVSLGQPALESDEPMSPPPDDGGRSSEPKSAGGLSSVFKGLTGAKLKSPPPPPAPAPASASSSSLAASQLPSASQADVGSSNPHGLPPNHIDAFEQLRSGPINERIAAANTLRYAIADYPLNPVLDIWYAGKDLVEPVKITTARHAGWELLAECAKHAASTDLERKEFFQTLSAAAHPDDFHLQLAAVVDLTRGGRDLSGFDYDVFPRLTGWLHEAYKAVKAARRQPGRPGKTIRGKASHSGEDQNFSDLFDFIVKVIKFNFKVADDGVVGRLILTLLDICMGTSAEDDL